VKSTVCWTSGEGVGCWKSGVINFLSLVIKLQCVHSLISNEPSLFYYAVLMGDITTQIAAQWDAQSGSMASQLFIAKNHLQTACMYIPRQGRQPVDI